MIRIRSLGALVALLAAVMLGAVVPASASTAPAKAPPVSTAPVPTAKVSGTCGNGVCVRMSRAETKEISDGGPAKAIGLMGPACLLIPMPLYSGICIAGVTAAGPGVSVIADIAVDRGQCSAFGVDAVNRRVQPAIAPCIE